MLAVTLSVETARGDEIAVANSAVEGASDTRHMGTAESVPECNEMNAHEMGMMGSYLMPFEIMTGEAGKWSATNSCTKKWMAVSWGQTTSASRKF